MTAATNGDQVRVPSQRRLWAGVAIAPTAWSIAELVGYIGAGRGCWPLWTQVRSIGPASSSVWTLIVAGAMLAAAATGLAIAVANLRAVPRDEAAVSRTHFMALFGTLGSAMFLFGIALFALPPIFNHACVATR